MIHYPYLTPQVVFTEQELLEIELELQRADRRLVADALTAEAQRLGMYGKPNPA